MEYFWSVYTGDQNEKLNFIALYQLWTDVQWMDKMLHQSAYEARLMMNLSDKLINNLPTGAGFPPSTVYWEHNGDLDSKNLYQR